MTQANATAWELTAESEALLEQMYPRPWEIKGTDTAMVRARLMEAERAAVARDRENLAGQVERGEWDSIFTDMVAQAVARDRAARGTLTAEMLSMGPRYEAFEVEWPASEWCCMGDDVAAHLHGEWLGRQAALRALGPIKQAASPEQAADCPCHVGGWTPGSGPDGEPHPEHMCQAALPEQAASNAAHAYVPMRRNVVGSPCQLCGKPGMQHAARARQGG